MQYLQALAHGCWLVSHAYVGACLDAGAWVPERQYQAWVSGRGWGWLGGIGCC